ncbi:MAG: hypothetical protein OSJ37_05185, partial [Muribaculaceae bacterium]|nr:hypothetical protein [Muribaculaceae bacterium]
DLRKISASQNNSENKSSVDSVSGLAKAEQPQILPNHCIFVSHLLAKLRNNAYICRTLKSFFELELQKPTTNNI